MRHNGGSGGGEHIVAVDMIQVIMRVDDKTNRQRGELADLVQQRLRRPRVLKGIDHQYAVVADHKSGIAAGQPFVIHDRGPNSIADLLQLKVRRRCFRRNYRECRPNQECRSRSAHHPARLAWGLRESCKVG